MSADDNAPEQAREVRETLIDVLAMSPMADAWGVDMQSVGRTADEILRALAPLRAAERQEAAREALRGASGRVAAVGKHARLDSARSRLDDARSHGRALGLDDATVEDVIARERRRASERGLPDDWSRIRAALTSVPAGTTDHEQQETTDVQ